LLKQENPRFIQGLNQLALENSLLFQAFKELTNHITTTDLTEFNEQSKSIQYFLLQDYLEGFPDLDLKKSQFTQLLQIIQTAKQGYYYLKKDYYIFIDKFSFKITKI
ncbi:TPA: tRNA(Ile)-lysidine synthetase, partial [Streptococcus pyogenes]|nr:tRNA(Ile)-lysidine synthetase [Streptococcus pyogenes]